MATSFQAIFDNAWVDEPTNTDRTDETSRDGAHAWLGVLLVLGSSVVALRSLCWIAAVTIQALH